MTRLIRELLEEEREGVMKRAVAEQQELVRLRGELAAAEKRVLAQVNVLEPADLAVHPDLARSVSRMNLAGNVLTMVGREIEAKNNPSSKIERK